ncbi:unnamed protein product [Peniophora sp. CBMAI 1063]|nr:unnamed protein product [Peniophora sp. CBMAI 1063]
MIGQFLGLGATTTEGADAWQFVDNDEMATQLEAAATETVHCQARLEEMHGVLQQMRARLGTMHAMVTRSTGSEAQTCKPSGNRDAEIAALRQELVESRREREKLAHLVGERDRALRHVTQERDSFAKLLASRTAELDAAQAFLPAADSVTDTHAIELVQALNYEISQAATVLVESLDDESRRLPISEKLYVAVCSSVKVVGQPIVDLLGSSSEDPMLSLQIGFQAVLVQMAKLEINCWSHRILTSDASKLDVIKEAMAKKEPEHVAVRWSALSHKYAKEAIDKQFGADELAARLARQWADAVTLAGYNGDLSSREKSKSVTAKVGPQLLEVAKLILQLNVVLGQTVLRGWMYCTGARAGEDYDPFTMEMDFQSEDVEVQDAREYSVIGVTALGLQRSEGAKDVTLLKSKVTVKSVAQSDV